MNFKQKTIFIFFAAYSLQILAQPYDRNSSKKCVDVVDCINNETVMSEFEQTLIQEYFNKVGPKLQGLLTLPRLHEINGMINAGPGVCKNYTVLPYIAYTAIQNGCGVFEQPIDDKYNEMLQNIFYENDFSQEKRDKYCPLFIELADERCAYYEHSATFILSCDFNEIADELYRKPWLECVKANS